MADQKPGPDERRRTRRLRVVVWIAAIGAVTFVAGGAAFVGGICSEFQKEFGTVGSGFRIGFLIGALGMLAAFVGLGLLIGSLVSWCVVRRPQFRLRTCFVVCLVFAALFASGPHVARVAAQAGISATKEHITILRTSPYWIELTFQLNPMLLVPVLLPALLVTLFVSRVYR